MKRLQSIILLFFLLSLVAMPGFSHASTNADLQAQIDAITKQEQALQAEQQKLESQLSATTAQKQTLQNAINQLNLTKTKLENDLRITSSNINKTSLKIAQISSNIQSDQATITLHKAAIAEALERLSQYDSYPLALELLSSQNLSDAWIDAAGLKSTEDSLGNEISDLEDAQQALTSDKSAAEVQKSNLVSQQAQLAGQQHVIQSETAAKSTLLSQTKSQEAQYQSMIANLKAQEQAFEDQLFQFQEQLKAAPSSEAPSAEHGILSWPLSHIRVTQQFGRTADSVRLYASGTHSGTDFAASVGTPVMAMGNGVIGGMGNTDDEKGCLSYGRWLFINYNNGLSSIYGHLSAIIVRTGDTVQAGQVVGYSGGQPGVYGSGYATGPHLHVGLFNSAGVSIQQYTSSIGCKQVSIPLANPSDYLDPMAYLPVL